MASLSEVASQALPGGLNILYLVIGVVIFFFMIAVVVGTAYYFHARKKKWNIRVEIKKSRHGAITIGEWGKANYHAKRGVVYILPNKERRAVPMKIFDIRRYLQGSDLITVLQVGPRDYRPVLNSSWSKHTVVKDGKKYKEAVLNIETETEQDKAWKASWEEAAKNAFTITSFLRNFQTPIAIGIVVLCCFIGFAILWTKIA